MRVADYVFRRLAEHGVRQAFLITGGAAMHLNDALGRQKEIEYICQHHEQACAIAAEGYARTGGQPAIVSVTAGPGGINAINGVFGAFTDSIPMIVISGQAKRETCMASYSIPGLRQLGDQEVDIVRMVEGVTKYAVLVMEPEKIRYYIDKAVYLATHGRPGPVWLDLPIDVQGAVITPEQLVPYDPAADQDEVQPTGDLVQAVTMIREKLAVSKRPVILAGNGVRLSKCEKLLNSLSAELQIPVVTGWNAHDLIPDEHPCYVGRPGTVGDRAGNFAVQNSDFLLVLGCRLNIRQISYNWKSFARVAFTVMVDIDPAELNKPTFQPDLAVHADLHEFLNLLASKADPSRPQHREWLQWCLERRRKYPVVLPEYWQTTEPVNPYCFVDELFRQAEATDTIVCGDGTACVTTFQGARIRAGQRLFSNSGCASMGYDLPASIGASLARNRQRVICIAGDGSIQMNLQELQTILTHQLPIKIFVLNNQGYHSIRQTQQNYFSDNIVGCGTESGLQFPSMERLAGAYGYPFVRCATHPELKKSIEDTLKSPGPRICEIVLDLSQQFAPKLASRRLEDGTMASSALEDMSPFLDRDELARNMLLSDQ